MIPLPHESPWWGGWGSNPRPRVTVPDSPYMEGRVVSSIGDAVRTALVTKDLRPETRRSYLSALKPFADLDLETLTLGDLQDVLMLIDNNNTRRKCIIALKSLVDHPAVKALKVPAAHSRKYDLPDETTLRLALMTSPHETRALLMMYGGLRLGESCAITSKSLIENRWLSVERQINETTRRVGPVKTNGSSNRIPIPRWLAPRIPYLEDYANPKGVRKSLWYAGKRVGIHINPHMLRHYYATTLIKKGVNPAVVQRLMRHANIRTTLAVYTQVNDTDLTNAIEDF